MKAAVLLASLLTGWSLTGAAAEAREPPAGNDPALEFFESRIRPILAEHCLSCHGPEKQRGGLRLDSREGVLKGNAAGPVLIPGHPDQSRLIRAIGYDGRIKMPPPGKLPPEAIADLKTWVRMGAPWPQDQKAGTLQVQTPAEAWKNHWAFQPLRPPVVPAVKQSAWVRSPVDAFILARLEEKGLTPAPPADRRTLLRRATFDLIGLPPTPQEIADFEADRSPDAFARVIDRLLASPQYGERWGRYWLDVARYADTKGYVFTEERKFPCSYSYRDYVIRSFNEDLPYNQFILQQLAADQLPLGEDKRPLAAMGFLTLGNRFMNNPQDIIDDRIDVVTRGLLGLTVTCARCHDHKFDPIPTKDYYSLYGVFASSTEPTVLPVLADPARKASFQAFEKELHAREEKLNQFLQKKQEELTARLRARVGDYLLAAEKMRRKPNTEEFMFVPAPEDLNPRLVERWQRYLEGTRAGFHPVFGPWHAFAALPAKEFAARAKDLATQFAANADPGKRINPVVARAFAGQAPTSLKEVAERYARLFTEADQLWQKQLQSGGGQSLKDPGQEQLRQVLYGPDAPANVPRNDLRRFLLDRAARDQLKKMRDEIDKFQANAPNAPPRAMVLEEAPTPYEPHVFLRGNPNRPGEAVPRQFLQILTGAHRQPFHHGSGRLELAQAMVDPRNPLTARVLVNRLWLHHFGAGLVRTPSDFGMRSEPPSHPELLDYLARKFMDDGWSIKKMHRLLMLSSVYQQSSDDNPRGPQVDPENRLLWHMNRQRLDFEALRDALLAVSGKLDRTMGGPSVSLTTPPFSTRRTVYGFVDRSNLPALFRTFDFPSPDTTSPQRYQTTVPLRALFLMNSPFVLEQARALANRPEIASQTRSDRKIQALYRLVYGRAAEPEETALGVHFLQDHHPEPSAGPRPGRALNALEQYAQVLLVSNEFAFVD